MHKTCREIHENNNNFKSTFFFFFLMKNIRQFKFNTNPVIS